MAEVERRGVLPPVPDRETGEPRPPVASRGESSGEEVTPAGSLPGSHPPLPEHLGPALEWTSPPQRVRRLTAIWMIIIAVVFLTVVNGPGWMSLWETWLVVVAGGAFMYWRNGREWFAAGAAWAQAGKSWVNTYELVKIKFSVDGVNRVLRLKDSSGREIYSFRLREFQANPRMWDLVYNGILHSVASGNCEITPKARKVLMLPAGAR